MLLEVPLIATTFILVLFSFFFFLIGYIRSVCFAFYHSMLPVLFLVHTNNQTSGVIIIFLDFRLE